MVKNCMILLLLIISISLIATSAFHLYQAESEYNEQKEIEDRRSLDATLTSPEEAFASSVSKEIEQQVQTNTSINPDFIGWIKFDSNLINLPVVQGTNNSFYLKHNFKKEESKYGCTFLGASQTPLSNNMTLYGHNIYNDKTVCFSPLLQLSEKENYEPNRLVSFITKSGDVFKYKIVSVVEYSGTDQPYFIQSEFNTSDWNSYIKYINTQKIYETNEFATMNDKILCFQTCIKHNDPRRFLIFAKLIN